MKRKLIIDGNAVYEIDENCMLKNRLDKEKEKEEQEDRQKSRFMKVPADCRGVLRSKAD